MSKLMRKISFILSFVLCIQLCSCGLIVINHDKLPGAEVTTDVPDKEPASTGDKEPDNTVQIITNDHTDKIKHNLALVADVDYNGAVFKITSPDVSTLDPDGEMEYLSAAAATRNDYVTKKHNISIVSSKVDYADFYGEVNTAVKSGMYYADLVMIPQEMITSFAAGNLILNMRSMLGMDFDAEYLNKSSVGAAAGGFDSYAVAGPASIYPYSLPAVFFNKDLCAKSGQDLYSLASSGAWTWDKFFEIAIGANENENYFSWGTTILGEAVYESAFVSSGMSIITSGIMKVPELAFDGESSATAVDILKRLYNTDKTIRYNLDSMAYFNEGNGFFQIEKLSAMTDLKNSKVNWGILPLPKATSEGCYRSFAGKDSLMIACPSTVSTPEKSATILMSLNAASEGIIKDSYINYIQYNFLRDNQSANMLEHIFEEIVYDFSYTHGDRYGAIADGTYNMIRLSATTDSDMQDLINRYKGSLDRTLAINFGLSN